VMPCPHANSGASAIRWYQMTTRLRRDGDEAPETERSADPGVSTSDGTSELGAHRWRLVRFNRGGKNNAHEGDCQPGIWTT